MLATFGSMGISLRGIDNDAPYMVKKLQGTEKVKPSSHMKLRTVVLDKVFHTAAHGSRSFYRNLLKMCMFLSPSGTARENQT